MVMKSSFKCHFFCFFFASVEIAGFGQDIVTRTFLESKQSWREGMVHTGDGHELHAFIRFDDKSGIITYLNSNESKTLIPRSGAYFMFYDEPVDRVRRFYAMRLDDRENHQRFHFFELLRECSTFAVLSKVDPVKIVRKRTKTERLMTASGVLMPARTITATEIHQTETLYFLGVDGEIRPYISILEKDVDIFPVNEAKPKSRFIKKDLFASFTGDHYDELTAFARTNHLSFKSKSDLMDILDYYHQLLGN